ncbi:pisatin demethylase [Thozetella sp. PMI_491]|nr:pisatin demethylase [Thozetella sp. PMI_491]
MAILSGRWSDLLAADYPALRVGAAVVLLFVLWSAASTVRQYYRLRHIKGPAGSGISKWWQIRKITSGRTQLDLYEVCQKYGELARIAPDELLTSDPDLIKHMTGARSQYKRSYWYYAMRFNPARDNVLSMIDDEQHRILRAKMSHGYSGKEVENLESTVDKNVSALVRLIQKYASEKTAFDLGRKAQFFTMDTISNIAFGDAFGFVESDSDLYDYCKIFAEQMPVIIFTTIYPWLVNVLQWPIVKSLLPSEKDLIGFGKVLGIAKDVTNKRYAPDAKPQKDMLGSFMAHGLTKDEAESETLLQILAGSDTTATAVRATLLYLMTNPRVSNKLLAEINASLGSLSSDREIITDAKARDMPYLQAVIKEGLRLYPPIVGLQSKEVPPGGDTWKGVYLPGGTKIGYCYWGMMRREDIWGHDADEFRPERWLEASPEKLARMQVVSDLTFGNGKWSCLGKNVAIMELNKVFVELLRRFDLVLVDPTNPWTSINAGAFIQSNFWVRAYERTE